MINVVGAARLLLRVQVAGLPLLDQGVLALPRALSRLTSSEVWTLTVASNSPSISVSNRSGTSITAAGVPAGSDSSQEAIREPTNGWTCASSQASSSRVGEDDLTDPRAVDRAVDDHAVPPPRSRSR